jgi:glutaminyl-tRNA synthetase
VSNPIAPQAAEAPAERQTSFARSSRGTPHLDGGTRPHAVSARACGYLHIGHAVDLPELRHARQFAGACNLRMDDTNPGEGRRQYVD